MAKIRAALEFCEALGYIYGYKLALVTRIPFKKIRDAINETTALTKYVQNSSEKIHLYRTKAAVRRAKKWVWWKKSYCLANALAGQKMLAKRGVSSVLTLGIKKENKKLKAHAWLEACGILVTGGIEIVEYSLVAKYVCSHASSAEVLRREHG